MSNRLNKDREQKLQPVRMEKAIAELKKLGITGEYDETTITFMYNGETIKFFPYSGWHQGKGIRPGRGLANLIKQLI